MRKVGSTCQQDQNIIVSFCLKIRVKELIVGLERIWGSHWRRTIALGRILLLEQICPFRQVLLIWNKSVAVKQILLI